PRTLMKAQARFAAKISARQTARPDPLSSLPDAPPAFVPPMMAKAVNCLPVGEQWRYELKLDGYRALAIKTAAGVKLMSRNKRDLSESYPELLEAVRSLPMREGVLDGEIVAVDEAGKPSFQSLQHLARFGRATRPILFFAFDLLNRDGKSLVSLPL